MDILFLITKPISEIPSVKAYADADGIDLTGQSFIAFSEVKAEIPEGIEVLFFGSSRAVDFFLSQASIPADCEIACIGSITKAHLQKLGYTVHFTGTQSGDPDSVAQELKSWLGGRTLHIAQSRRSNRSMAKALPESQIVEMVVYDTQLAPHRIEKPFSLIIFTSPSNLEGYLLSNTISPDCIIVASGKTTERALQSLGYKVHIVLKDTSEEEFTKVLRFSKFRK